MSTFKYTQLQDLGFMPFLWACFRESIYSAWGAGGVVSTIVSLLIPLIIKSARKVDNEMLNDLMWQAPLGVFLIWLLGALLYLLTGFTELLLKNTPA